MRNKDVTAILGFIKVTLENLHQRQDAAGVGPAASCPIPAPSGVLSRPRAQRRLVPAAWMDLDTRGPHVQ